MNQANQSTLAAGSSTDPAAEAAALDAMFVDTIDRLCADQANRALREQAEDGVWPAALWAAFDEIGLVRCLVSEAAGGAGISLCSALRALKRTAYHAVPLPLAESMMATRLLQAAGLEVPEGVLTVARLDPEGAMPRVAWGERAGFIVTVGAGGDGDTVSLLSGRATLIRQEKNLAGEPRPTLGRAGLQQVAHAQLGGAANLLELYGALARSAQMAGALERALHLSLEYANERVQFGRPIGKFQAVQHLLAVQASHAAAASAACDAAIDASLDAPESFLVALAKARTSEAAGQGADIAHQVHGAMGFTREHSLHHVTRRLYAWRDEYGGEAYWQQRIGRLICAQGADAFWPMLTGL
ncbi:MAG: acyl-CoA dehydrogenase family protein [Betaproteobacteria bacterium]|nr:acyl-CoA dehydrogenase family protein [Betaproteobacteria bacterium]